MRASLLLVLSLVLACCSNGDGGTDAGIDGVDSGDAGTGDGDAGFDAGGDLEGDLGGDTGGDEGGDDSGPCTVVPQGGCPGGHACVPNTLQDETGVCRTAGSKDTWEVCTPGANECLPGNLCMDVGGEGWCLKLCSADEQCERNYECYKGDRLIDIEWVNLGFCLITSDDQCSLPDTDCLQGEKCAPYGGHEALICKPAGDKAVGQNCGSQDTDDCDSGAICIDRGGISQCEQLCSQDYTCLDADAVCLDFFENANVGVCLGGECSLPDVGCGAGEGCYIVGGAAYVCLPEGTAGAGDSCEQEDCAAGLICVHSVSSGTTCRPLCDEGNPCNQAGEYCAFPWDDLPFSGYCKEMCNPVTQEECDVDEGCYTDYDGETLCFDAGSLEVGEDCSNMMLCVPGAECIEIDSTGEYRCRLFCDDDHPCAQGTCTRTKYRGVKVCL
jgi:hypothetical protein